MARTSSSRAPASRPARTAVLVVLLCGLVATLVGSAVVALNEPTQMPDVSSTLVVRARAQVTGERTLGAGVVLLALGVGFQLGHGTRPAKAKPKRPASRGRAPAPRPRPAPVRAPAVTRGTVRQAPPRRRTASK